MKIKIKKLDPKAVVPAYAHEGDAGLDLTAITMTVSGEVVTYGTGLAFEIPKGYVGLIFLRSSVFKYDLSPTNCVGVIDSGYRGEVSVKLKRKGKVFYEPGDRVAQMIILPYPQVEFVESESLSSTERGTGGYGSTGV